MHIISSQDQLDALYNTPPALASTAKELDYLIPEYKKYIEASPFVALATVGPEGLDCSPRGDAKGFVRIIDDKTLAMPDRRGNNRIDSLRNIVRDPRVALLFLIPGSGTTFRVNGKAVITADPELCASFEFDGKQPRSVIVVTVERTYFQCARAVVRSSLWDSTRHADPKSIPTPGQVLQRTSNGEIQAKTYDEEWPGRAAKSMW
jgi:uncharacterized protein